MGEDRTSSTTDALQMQLQALRAAYVARLPEKIGRLSEICRAVLEANPNDEQVSLGRDARTSAHRLAHNLAGSGATYGFANVGGAARRLELALLECGDADTIGARDAQRLRTLFSELENEIARISSGDDEVAPEPPQVLAKASPPSIPTISFKTDAWRQVLSDAPLKEDDNRLIFLAATDREIGDEIAQQIGHFGYKVRVFPLATSESSMMHLESLVRALVRDRPAALIISESPVRGDEECPVFDTPETTFSSLHIAHAVRHEGLALETLPLIFLSHCTDMESRLRAVRAGGTAYFAHPIEISEVIDKLDTLTSQEMPEPYRVLVVDDDPELSAFFALTLGDAGLSTRIVNDPLQIIGALNDYRPDLILMDVYMPDCNGLELATAIRQQEDYVGIPIVFLSAETNVDKQMAALGTGGDDFLTKPILPDHLVASVRARAQRSRTVRSFMVRDSLTGLLNHTTTKEQIDIEVSRAARTKASLSLVMLDIDHFKSVNDTHGHLAGDRVIKGISRLLQQRLRKTDIIGRYGGEEFAVLLPNTDAETARHIMEEIRVGFSQIRHGPAGNEFHVTFSAGIAAFPECDDAVQLGAVADNALYEAKRTGRDRVVVGLAEPVEA